MPQLMQVQMMEDGAAVFLSPEQVIAISPHKHDNATLERMHGDCAIVMTTHGVRWVVLGHAVALAQRWEEARNAAPAA